MSDCLCLFVCVRGREREKVREKKMIAMLLFNTVLYCAVLSCTVPYYTDFALLNFL